MSNSEKIQCSLHGKADITYVCQHLINGEDHDWYCHEPDAATPCPDAWCGACHQHFEEEGEWNEFSETAADLTRNIKLLCHECYEQLRAQCQTHYI